MKREKRGKRVPAVVAAIFAIATCSQAAIYSWDSGTGMYNSGNQIQGNTVTYDQVASDTGLYGNMQISGDQMWLFPTTFQAESQDGGSVTVDETLQFSLESKPGGGTGNDRFIDSIQFIEYGDYALLDYIGGAGTDLTRAIVSCGLTVVILERNRTPVFGAPITGQLTFTPSAGDYFLDADGETSLTQWQGSLNLALPYDDITKVQVSIDNILSVTSEDGTYARIEKKGFGENPSVMVAPVIPEPSSLALMTVISGAGWMVRRRFRK